MSTTSSPTTLYDASAGSGKTFTVVRKYLTLLFNASRKNHYKNILAITFTNKAVAEMKERVVDSLRAFSEQEIPKKSRALFDLVQEDTGLSEEVLQQKSREILKHLLHNYAAFDISTIDRFTHRVLRTFAKDLGIPVNFEVELDTQALFHEAVDRIVAKAGSDKELTKTLIDFALSKADDDKSWDISKDLYDIAKLLGNEDNLQPLSKLADYSLKDFKEFTKKLQQETKQLKEQAIQFAQEFFKLLNENQLDPKDFTSSYIPKHFQKIIDQRDAYPSGAKWQQNIETDPMYAKKQTDDKKAIMDGLQPQIADLYLKVEGIALKIELFGMIQKRMTSLSLLQTINHEVEKIKEERGLLLISEFNKKISASISNQPAPFIYERLGERYHDYFIDEFQDTSVMQWQNLIPLITNSLSEADPDGKMGSLTLVGDAKQSIYRWRGGKAEQFIAMSAGHNPFPVDMEIEKLPANYRSLPEVVNFNNSFFQHISQFVSFELYRDLFENAKQEPTKEEGGYVQIDFIEAENAAEKDEVYPEKVKEIILDLEGDGYTKQEICILVRKKKEGIAIANYLSAEGIPIISSETLLIKQSPKVCFLNALLQYAMKTSDKILKFEMLDFLWNQEQPDESSFQFTSEKINLESTELFESLSSYGYHFDLQKFHRLPLYDAFEYAVRCFKLNDAEDAYLQFYLDFVYEYVQKNTGGAAGFIDHWLQHEDKLSISAPEGENAVQILTIHKSKGLEFPVVIYPYANESYVDTKMDSVWVDLPEEMENIPLAYLSANKKMAEIGGNTAESYHELMIHKELDTFNMYYVAMTRAEQQLYIISELDLTSKGNENTDRFSGLLIDFLKSQNLWNQEQLQHSFGQRPEKEAAIPAEISEETRFISSPPEDHEVVLVTKSAQLWGTTQEEAIEKGNRLHEILSSVKTEKDLNDALDKAILNGLILKKERATYLTQLEAIVQHPELQLYFSEKPNVYNEKEIITNGAFKRLDRLCIFEKDAVIIDYKTGAFAPKHQQQIQEYADAIEAMGFNVQKKLLVYLNESVSVHTN